MSIDFGKGDLLFEQRLLACGGFYAGKLDGLWGDKSKAAALAANSSYLAIKQNLGSFDARSEKNILTLLPEMQKKARFILKAAYKWGGSGSLGPNGKSYTFAVLSGTRTYAEQDALFRQRPKVTNARGGQSNHNFGIALDIGIFDIKGKYLTGSTRAEEKAYTDLAAAVKAAVSGIEWGGDWKSFKDQPHYEFNTGLTIAQKRAKFESGKLFLSA